MEWASMPDAPANDPSGLTVEFSSGYPSISYEELFSLNGLEVMQLSDKARLKPDSSPVIFKLTGRELVKPLRQDLIEAVKNALEKI
jgi:hypothetical protein